MDAMVWMTGYVGGDVEFRTVKEEYTFASFRLACTPRQWRGGEWVDAETTWIAVSCSRGLAENVRSSIGKGDPVVVAGKLRTDRWTDAQGSSHERLVIEAVSVGHDLSRGTSVFRRGGRSTPEPVAEVAEVSESAA
jgi:single-strand DNA-binding protein